MAIYATKEAQAFWKGCSQQARSLAASHYASIAENNDDSEWRTELCSNIARGAVENKKNKSYCDWISAMADSSATVVYGKLEARLILNSSTGLGENTGMSLDRNSGTPYIQGSAIKGVTRRYAIWILSNTENADEKATLLAQIALVFGYGDSEWKTGRDLNKGHSHSDFWLAMTPLHDAGEKYDTARDVLWAEVSQKAAAIILESIGKENTDYKKPLGEKLPSISGSVAFLPAFPAKDPGVESDIITAHHTKYYKRDKTQKIATDDEAPIPIVFPAVRAGADFRFPLLPLHRSQQNPELLELAKSWLTQAIQIFGLGAKTNAGYGWFSIDQIAQNKANLERKEKEAEKQKAEKLAAMSTEERTSFELTELPHQEFVSICKNIANEDETKQKTVCAMLKNSKKEDWKKWRKQKKGDWPDKVPVIREIAKQHGIELS